MSNTDSFSDKMKHILGVLRDVSKKVGHVIWIIFSWIFKLRKVFMAIPVVYAAIHIAIVNAERLPEYVGLNLQSNGEFAMMVTRSYAVFGPLLVTAFCLILMFFSRKTVFPWIISIFSLVLPFLIYFTNYSFL